MSSTKASWSSSMDKHDSWVAQLISIHLLCSHTQGNEIATVCLTGAQTPPSHISSLKAEMFENKNILNSHLKRAVSDVAQRRTGQEVCPWPGTQLGWGRNLHQVRKTVGFVTHLAEQAPLFTQDAPVSGRHRAAVGWRTWEGKDWS